MFPDDYTRSSINKVPNVTLVVLFLCIPFFSIVVYKGYFIVVACGLIGTLIAYLMKWHGRLPNPRNAWIVYGFLLLPLISLAWSIDPIRTLWKGSLLTVFIPLFYIAYCAVREIGVKSIKQVVTATVLSNMLACAVIVMIYGSFRPGNFLEHTEIGVFSNVASCMMVFCIPFLIAFRQVNLVGRNRFIFLFSACLVTIILSESRSAYVLAVISIILYFAFRPGNALRKVKWLYSGILLFGLIAVILFTFEPLRVYMDAVIQRFADSQLFSGGSITEVRKDAPDFMRAAMYYYGFQSIIQHPLTGIGYAALQSYMLARIGVGIVSHNILITYWGGAGVLGLCFLFLLYGYTCNRLRKCLRDRTQTRDGRLILAACLSAFVVMMVYSLIRNLPHMYYFPIIIGWSYALIRACESRKFTLLQNNM